MITNSIRDVKITKIILTFFTNKSATDILRAFEPLWQLKTVTIDFYDIKIIFFTIHMHDLRFKKLFRKQKVLHFA